MTNQSNAEGRLRPEQYRELHRLAAIQSDWEIDPRHWAAALDRSRAGEEQQRAKFPNGKPFPIPDREVELMDDAPAAPAPAPQPEFYAVNDRPVKLVPTDDGGLDVQALNMRTGVFERDMGYLTRCITGEGDVDKYANPAEFEARVAAIRKQIAARG